MLAVIILTVTACIHFLAGNQTLGIVFFCLAWFWLGIKELCITLEKINAQNNQAKQ
jgi:hypothetical protein